MQFVNLKSCINIYLDLFVVFNFVKLLMPNINNQLKINVSAKKSKEKLHNSLIILKFTILFTS